jgi:hypothetical protein
MEETFEKTSTWLALRNPVFRKLWLAMVVSGSCIGAHNTAVDRALNKLGASTLTLPFCQSGKVAGLKPDSKRSFFLPPLSTKLLFILF